MDGVVDEVEQSAAQLRRVGEQDQVGYVGELPLPRREDTRRIEYIDRAVASMRAQIERGVDVRGFLYWSALDNFEWQVGYGPRFGLIEVDRVTQERRPKPSAAHFGRIATTAALPARP